MGREGKRMEMKENVSSSAPVEINMPDSHTFARARMKARARVRARAHTHTHTHIHIHGQHEHSRQPQPNLRPPVRAAGIVKRIQLYSLARRGAIVSCPQRTTSCQHQRESVAPSLRRVVGPDVSRCARRVLHRCPGRLVTKACHKRGPSVKRHRDPCIVPCGDRESVRHAGSGQRER
jgi:hypothetical protein